MGYEDYMTRGNSQTVKGWPPVWKTLKAIFQNRSQSQYWPWTGQRVDKRIMVRWPVNLK